MTVKDLKIFSQNIQKNNFIINTILKVNHNFDVIFIQEPSWTTIRSIPSPENCEGIPLVGIPNYPNWLTFARESDSVNDSSRVILLVFFFNNNNNFWIMNIYSDSSHSALKYFKDSETNI